MKRCRCCGSLMFDDMDTCYECMHPCDRQTARDAASSVERGRDVGDGAPRDAPTAPVPPSATASFELDLSRYGDVAANFDIFAFADAASNPPSDSSPTILVDAGDLSDRVVAWSISVSGGDGGGCRAGEGGTAPGRVVRSGGRRLSIGRASDNDIVLPDKRVSRHHAQVNLDGEALWLRDMGSKNMTYIHGVPVIGSVLLSPGVQVSIGPYKLSIAASLIAVPKVC